MFFYLLSCWCFAAWMVAPLKGEAQKHADVGAMIDEFILAEEFKGDERAKLHALPVEAVELLTQRLNHINVDLLGELRIYECLALKVVQFDAVLAPAAKAAALAALESKMGDEKSQFYSHRLQLYNSVMTPSSQIDISASVLSVPEPNHRPSQQPLFSKKALKSKLEPLISSSERTSLTLWLVAAVVIVAALGLTWLVLKKR